MTAIIQGRAGRAWLFNITPEMRAQRPHGLDCYLIHQPGVHMLWSWWIVTGCDLFDDDADPNVWGRLPAHLEKAGNTHEFMCFALDPATGFYAGNEPPDGWDSADATVESRWARHRLAPSEFIYQEKLRDNDQANEIMCMFVRAVCDGHTAADADFRRHNIKLLAATAEHFRAGMHEVH